MECLWGHDLPLSCGELQLNCSNLSEKAIYVALKNLEDKKAINKAIARKNSVVANRKPTQLYAPTITNLDYMETLITSSPLFTDETIPKFFRRFISKPHNEALLKELEEMIEEARGLEK